MKKSLLGKRDLAIVILLGILAYGLRAYALPRDLFFAYDQGRDALEMAKFSHGDFTLIGPTTGLSGVFLGPFWYYLLFPFYLVGRGDPVIAALGMIGFHGLLTGILYGIGKRLGGVSAGIAASLLFTFSFVNIRFARWLSNPTPLPFFATLSFVTLWLALKKRTWWLYMLVGFLFGLCLQLEAANAIWFIPAAALSVAIEELQFHRSKVGKKPIRPSLTERLISIVHIGAWMGLGFFVTTLAQVLFELQSTFLITKNLITSFQTTHAVSLRESLPTRLPLLFSYFAQGLYPDYHWIFGIVSIVALVLFLRLHRVLWKHRGFRVVFLWFVVPLFFHSLYTGNYGNFWDYYLIAQHTALYLLIATIFGVAIERLPRFRIGLVIFLVLLVGVSIFLNGKKWMGFLTPYEDRFAISMQIAATNWIIDEAGGQPYGVWVYTPDAQDQAHRYIFSFVGKKRGVYPQEHVEQQPLIFLVVEDDPGHEQRRQEWIKSNLEFGILLKEEKFGAIRVFKIQNTSPTLRVPS